MEDPLKISIAEELPSVNIWNNKKEKDKVLRKCAERWDL